MSVNKNVTVPRGNTTSDRMRPTIAAPFGSPLERPGATLLPRALPVWQSCVSLSAGLAYRPAWDGRLLNGWGMPYPSWRHLLQPGGDGSEANPERARHAS